MIIDDYNNIGAFRDQYIVIVKLQIYYSFGHLNMFCIYDFVLMPSMLAFVVRTVLVSRLLFHKYLTSYSLFHFCSFGYVHSFVMLNTSNC